MLAFFMEVLLNPIIFCLGLLLIRKMIDNKWLENENNGFSRNAHYYFGVSAILVLGSAALKVALQYPQILIFV